MKTMGSAIVDARVRQTQRMRRPTLYIAGLLCLVFVAVQAQADEFAEARKILKQADDMASKIEHGVVRDYLFHDIALAKAQAQDLEKAIHIAAHINESLSRAATVEEIVEVLAKSGRIQEALGTAATIEDPENRAGAM